MKKQISTFKIIVSVAAMFSMLESFADATYDVASRIPGTNFFVYTGNNDGDNTPPLVSTTPSSEITDYSGLLAPDGASLSYSVPSNGRLGQVRFQLTIDETAAELSQLNISWQGSGVNSHSPRTDGALLYIWNYSTSAYELLDSTTSASSVTLAGSITTSFVNYLGGASTDTLTFIVVTADSRTGNRDNILNTDYFSVETIGAVVPAADYFTLALSNNGIYCLAHTIGITVYDVSNALVSDYAEQITLNSQSGNGSWSLLSGNGTLTDAIADDGLAVYNFDSTDGGTASFSLSYQQGATPINIDAYQTSETTIRDDDTEGNVAFAPSGITITELFLGNPVPNPIDSSISAQTAGTDFTLYLTAYGQTATDSTCGVIESYTGNQDISFWSNYSNPTTGTLTPIVNASSIAATEGTSAAQTVNFNNGQAAITVKYKDVGAISLNLKDVDPSGDITGSTPAFVVKPADFNITVTGNPAAADASGPAFRKAGESFTAVVEVLDSEGDVTPNYGNETDAEGISIASTTLVAPIGGRNGTANDGAIANATDFSVTATQGIFSGSTFSFNEVGIIQLTAEVDGQDYLGAGNTVGTESGNVGRFTPWRLTVELDEPLNPPMFRNGLSTWSCALTYQGQAFAYSAGLNPVFKVTAVNNAGTATYNYGNDFWKLSTDLSDRTYINNVAGIVASLGFNLAAATVILSGKSELIDGEGLLTITNEQLTYSKNAVTAVAADASFAADINLVLTTTSLTDSDSICHDSDNDSTCDGYTVSAITGTDIHYGRLTLDNGYGSELAAIVMEVRAETYNGVNFVTNTLDTCTEDLTEWTGFTLSNYTSNLSSGETTASFGSLAAGVGSLTLSAPGAGNDGTVRVTLNGPSWMQYDYDADTSEEDVRATASFGIWPGRKPIILIRETYR